MVRAGPAQRGVEVLGRQARCAGAPRDDRRGNSFGAGGANPGHGVPRPVTGRRAGVHLDACGAVALRGQLGGQPGLGVQRQHLLDFEPGHLQVAGRHPESLGSGAQDDLGKTCTGHDRLTVHLVVGQPGVGVGPGVGLPGMPGAPGQFDVQSQQRVRPGERLPGGRCLHPVAGVHPRCRRKVDEQIPAVGRGGVDRRPHQRELGVEGQRFGLVPVHRSGHPRVALAQRLVDRVGQQRVRADLDEGAVIGGRRLHGPTEPDRVAQVRHPVFGAEYRCVAGIFGGVDDRDGGADRIQIRQRGAQFREDRIDGGVMGGHVDLDAAGQQALGIHLGDQFVDQIRGPGNHRLVRRRVHRDGDVGVVGDQPFGRAGVQFHQGHRALPGQPRHQPGAGGDHVQAFGGRQRAGDHGRGHLAHRVADDRVGVHAVGAPQLGQRQLDAHQHRLDPGDPGERFAHLQDVAQGKAHLVDENRLEGVDRRGERRLVGQ